MPNFDAPDADWTDEYDWTRYRGAQPYPCPGDWVLNLPEEGGATWHYYPDHGWEFETDDDVAKAFEPEYDDWNDAREGTAFLMPTIIEDDLVARESTREWELQICGAVVFRRVEPNHEELWAAAAEALARHSDGEAIDDFASEVVPDSGRVPDEVAHQQRIEQRKQDNNSLEDFNDG